MGSLQESLNRFKKQQEKCQSTLKSIAGSKTTTKTTAPPPRAVPASTLAKSPLPAVKFSNDTERLQHINNIRKSPVGAQIKRVIDLLFELYTLSKQINEFACASRQSFTAEQINEACYVDVKGNKAVFESLAKNPKVNYEGKRFSYKSKHNVRDQKELLRLIRTFAEGIAVADLKDAYPTVMEDLQEDIAYPNDPRVPIKVDDELKGLFRAIELPRDMLDIERELQKNGMKPATNTAKRRVAAQNFGILTKPKQKKKKTEISKRTKLTNAHLPELFRNLNG
ncbi:Transcription factor TFIIE beta subunit, DNA-binding domain-containing protein [Cynara cardunculus var. scolymus]|uniref:Transcription factor TFIIE beta subunit, DNA-binding domain-containing protein n=1 Tax=Cynara cardunculus var. scolymus TaxID=59895 RepID=A0A103YKR8_CYNCS|nr:Transcription factor TFIIE beta subunit, DNA-binding domain-containing protein [Cynara cardunculus var. scolymus]